ncbi:MAG: hypothetical protein Unbinned1966contig1000_26 [Prokaryotic dsDNA virus sp.]|nr:MAG: hypothetical protein Unbinned1966contig1000_26 [Prokaryotic dsDNA virus sp.]|tara:strand:- start:522 stop:698 length:177 start_codon:yes stop_codon:yes gene_type:complete
MPKTKKTRDPIDEIDNILKTIDKLEGNMDILNTNMQHAIDLQEEIGRDLDKIKKRMGL